MEKGYRLKMNDKWMAIRRFYGEYVYKLYEDEKNPNVVELLPLHVAEKLKNMATKELYDKIIIVECGELTDDNKNLSIFQVLTKRFIK